MTSPAGSDAPSPFDTASLRAGAVITSAGLTGEQIVAAVESTLTDAAPRGDGHDRWLLPDLPALSRGDAWIIPLSWEPESLDGSEVRDRATELWSRVRGACEYRHGVQIGIDLEPDRVSPDAYAAELLRTGARRADWWAFGDRAVVLVVYGPPLPGLKTSIALHVVPRAWVWDDAAHVKATATDLRISDLRWSWADVVRFAGRD